MLIAALGASETLLRAHRHRPSVIDGPDLWSQSRDQIYGTQPGEVVVLLGGSRMQVGISIAEFRHRLPDLRVSQLAVVGRHPLASLQDLAMDERFHGLVVCAVSALSFIPKMRDDQAGYVAYFRKRWNVNAKLNRAIASAIQDRLVIVHPQVSLLYTVKTLLRRGSFPRPLFMITRRDRSRLADYSLPEIAELRRARIRGLRRFYRRNTPPEPDQWLERASDVEPWVESIQGRGGQVVFVRFPTSEEYLRLDEEFYPRALYWDRFASMTRAVTIHFLDVPGMADFDLPDTSHLDYRDAGAFTGVLIDALAERGALEPPGPGRGALRGDR